MYRDDLKSTISQKLKLQKSENCFFIRFSTLRIFWDKFFCPLFWSKYIDSENLKYKIDHISKTKIAKIWKLFIHRFQKIAQTFGTKSKLGHFWEGGGRGFVNYMSLIDTGSMLARSRNNIISILIFSITDTL